MASTILAVLGMLLIQILVIPAGALLLHLFFSKRLESIPLLIRFPLYAGVGLAALTVVTVGIGFFLVSPVILFLFMVAITGFGAYKLWQKGTWSVTRKNLIELFSFENLLFLALYLVSQYLFASVTGVLKWPSPADPTRDGQIVSLILFHRRLPFTYSPFGALSIAYPIGFHTICAYMSLLIHTYPIDSVFITSAYLISLLPPMLFSTVYFRTKSKIFSTLAFLSVFLIYPESYILVWPISYYYNASVPVLIAFVFFMTFFALLCITPAHFSEPIELGRFLLLLSIIGSACAFCYPNLAPFLLLFMLLLLLINRKTIKIGLVNFYRWKPQLLVFSIIGIVSGLFIIGILLAPLVVQYVGGPGPPHYEIDPLFYVNNVNGLVITISILVSAFFWFFSREKWGNAILLHFLVFIAVLFSLITLLREYIFSYILPQRSLIVLMMMSWVLFANFFHVGYSKCQEYLSSISFSVNVSIPRLQNNQSFHPQKVVLPVLSMVLVGVLFIPPLYPHFSLDLAKQWGWFQYMPYFDDDYQACIWIAKEIPSDQLILNDRSYTAYYLPSYGVRELVYCIGENQTRAEASWQLWVQANNSEVVKEILSTYEIKYIFSASEWGYWNRSAPEGISYYHGKPWVPQTYKIWFSAYPFLELVFSSNNTTVFKVLEDQL